MQNFQEKDSAARKYFQSGNIKLSYLDFGGGSEHILLTLHGHMNDARTYAELATRFKNWRVIGLDQRGHGWSEHPRDKDYSRESYLEDILNLIRIELGGQPVTILGHSLGGVNAYQFAARYPELVHAVIVEDIGAEIHADLSFAETLPKRSSSLKELRKSLELAGLKAIDYFSESVFEDEAGWGFRSDLKGMVISAQNLNGVWWEDWLSSRCPILLIHGKKSFVLNAGQAELMVLRRPNTKLEVFEPCGHGVHSDDPDGFYQVVNEFLATVF
ncbi:Pimeloyl-ACP methyl ester carboxylesterase [Paenibacillus algorifonticola]|uniref:Pimeloyl-ACP methyl ester carboxylesterase n=1 Tax=Paenibacillus algorifonticola TaxID=684063 RepID=A0A1I2FS66_9BACL|nr:alpha/beta hydrolase [Paenibacillus algorifonticola]SFF07490.1 Pimeloyl-ACP methyl ester carboxylesterase [Paenibacillus algorifonticola]